ncbi:MAG: ABC transporter ATP-binding protein [Marinifilaceae bacterium]
MKSINITNIDFGYSPQKLTLKNVSLEALKGDMVAIIGQNGSGKSTLLKCINKILKVKHGTIEINGVAIKQISDNKLAHTIAYIPQSTPEIQGVSVFDTVLLGRKPYINSSPHEHDLEVVSTLLQRLNLTDIAMRNINTLSGGQQQRVYIARALAQEPSILLLDEPIANLDINHQMKVMQLLKELTTEGITVIITIHDVNIAARFCNKALMLKNGEVFASGTQSVYTSENIEYLYDIGVDVIQHNDSICIIPRNN